jgi:hypothetical protein
MIIKHGEARGADRWDALSKAWVKAEEWQQRQWAREDAAFARKNNQGELCAPRIIGDTTAKPLQSPVTGKWHESKASLRREYREHGVVEIGNDVPKARPAGYKRPEAESRLTFEALRRAKNELDFPSHVTGIKHDPDGMQRLRRQGKV